MLAAMSITFFFVTDVECGLYEINQIKCYTVHMDQVWSKKCPENETEQCWTGEVQDQDLDLY